jgi:hypothetical protein
MIPSPTQWAFAEFSDPYNAIADDEVSTFEGIARNLLQQSAGSGHACKLVVKPTETIAGYRFAFTFAVTRKGFSATGNVPDSTPGGDASGGEVLALVPRGAFQTKGKPNGAGMVKVTGVQVPLIPLKVDDHGKQHVVTLSVRTKGLDFKVTPPTNVLQLSVVVKSSSEPGCRRGAKGTLTLQKTQTINVANGPAEVALNVCGSLFKGATHGTVVIQGA